MKIGFDISHSVGERSGLGSYAMGLLKGLAEIAAEDELVACSFFYNRFPRDWRKARVPDARNVKLNHPSSPDFLLKRRLAAGGRAAESLWGDVDIIHSNGYAAPVLENSRLVFTLYDATIYLMPEAHTRANYDFVNRNLHRAARNASAIIAISEQTRRDAQRFLHIEDNRISVVYGAADERFRADVPEEEIRRVKRKHSIEGDYILTVSTIEPRKNLIRLVAACGELRRRGLPHKLVIAGQRGWMSEPLFEFIAKERLSELVIFAGYVADCDLPALYSGASAFACVSLYEGFGLPLIEAMACGAPSIASNGSSLVEVAGDGALLVDPENEMEIAEALMRVIEDERLRDHLRERGIARSKEFSWRQSAEELLRVYRKVMSEAR